MPAGGDRRETSGRGARRIEAGHHCQQQLVRMQMLLAGLCRGGLCCLTGSASATAAGRGCPSAIESWPNQPPGIWRWWLGPVWRKGGMGPAAASGDAERYAAADAMSASELALTGLQQSSLGHIVCRFATVNQGAGRL